MSRQHERCARGVVSVQFSIPTRRGRRWCIRRGQDSISSLFFQDEERSTKNSHPPPPPPPFNRDRDTHMSSLESTPVSIWVPKQVGCSMCRISTCFSFFSCEDDSDRLMKRASSSCCIFVCVVLAAAYLKYRQYRLSCLPFVLHFFSL